MNARKLLTAAAMSSAALANLTGCHATQAPTAVTAASVTTTTPAPAALAAANAPTPRASETIQRVAATVPIAAVPLPERAQCRMGNTKGPSHENCADPAP